VITASSDKSCRLWDTDSGACLQTMEGHTDEIFSCAFNYEVRAVIRAYVLGSQKGSQSHGWVVC
jgi:WD40 repeat protein